MNITKIYTYIAITALIVFGSFLRFYQLSHQSYWMDEGYTVNAVLSINETGSSILDSGQSYFCPMYCYPTSYITKIFGDNAFSFRFLSVIFGILFILGIFYIVRKLFNNKIALLSSFFVTFSYLQIAWSRQARWYTLFSVLFWLAIYFFYKTLYSEKNKIWYLILTTIFTTLTILTHGLGYLLPFIFLAWFLIDEVFIKKSFDWKKTALSITILIIGIFSLISIFHVGLFTALISKLNLYYELPYYLSFFFRNYWLFIVLSLITLNISDLKYKKEIWYLVFVFLSYFLSLSFLTNIVHYRYIFHVTPVIFILSSIAIVYIIENIPKLYQKITFALVIIILFFTIGGGVIIPTNTYYLESDNPATLGNRPHYAYTPQPEWNTAYQYIKDNKKNNEIIISSMPQFNKIFLNESGYWIQYDYLGMTNKTNIIKNDQEYYVGAKVISDLSDLEATIKNNHGYIIFDYMAIDGKIPKEIIEYITKNTKEVFYKNTNPFSQVWVYQF
jgi:4-amino-4-deoxy-L-arabinose transferase-like glycosyltransferase